jgi:hypothetical protein
VNPNTGVDEERFAACQRLIKLTALRGTPLEGDSCGNCCYFVAPPDPMGFCRHERLQCLVGSDWWCQHWEMSEEDP